MLHFVLRAAAGEPLQDYSERVLFGPIGMRGAEWQLRTAPGFLGGHTLGLVAPPRDMARFGLLVLAGGR
jgi:CubicO group peptidase (beta-lactamase class C family)